MQTVKSFLAFGGWILFVQSLICLTPLQADTLDWNSVSWTSGDTNETFAVGSTNVTIDLSGDTSFNSPPVDSNFLHATGDPSGQSLFLDMAWDTIGDSLVVTISFDRLVNNVNFTIFDIDRIIGTYRDRIGTISATDGTTTYYATVTGTSGGNTASNSGTSSATILGSSFFGVAAGTSEGNGTISFGSSPINAISFTYSAAIEPDSQQYIGLGDINYSVYIPEAHTALAALLLIGLVCLKRERSPHWIKLLH